MTLSFFESLKDAWSILVNNHDFCMLFSLYGALFSLMVLLYLIFDPKFNK